MPAIFDGRVFNDLSRTAQDIPSNPGISGAYVVLYQPNGTCQTTTTNASGQYSFSATIPGDYYIYETAIAPNACPPTVFGQPSGFNDSTTQRIQVWTGVTQQDINNNNSFGVGFGHVVNTAWSCSTESVQISENPSQLSTIDLATGTVTNKGSLVPSALYNAIGYSVVDNMIYGWSQTAQKVVSISQYTTVNLLAGVNGIPQGSQFDVGDVDLQGHLYLYKDGDTRFYVVDVNPNSATFLKLVDPANGFKEQTSNFGVAIASSSIFDWAFNPIDNQLYSVNTLGGVVKVDPVTGAKTQITTTGFPSATYGAVWFDNSGNFYAIRNDTGVVYKVTISGSSATAVAFSQANQSNNNDGARCPRASIGGPVIYKTVNKSAAKPGDTLIYSIMVTNTGSATLNNIIVTDPIPSGTTFVNGSVTVNGSSFSGNPANGINIGSLASNNSSTVTFKVVIGNTLPIPNPIPNTASMTYDGSASPKYSNTVDTIVFDNSRGVAFI